MIEKLPFKVDINAMRDALHIIKQMPITMQAKEFGYNNFGGWSVLSREGTCEDGWQVGEENCEGKEYNWTLAKYLNLSHAFEHANKTPACIGEIDRIITLLEENRFYPRRARVTVLKANSSSIVHADAPSDVYMCRIHIPLITNPKCIHWTENGESHMPADGSVYMLPVNVLHQIRNDSDEDRYHLIMDAYDTRKFTRTMRYSGSMKSIEYLARLHRDGIDNAKLTIVHKLIYYIGKQIYKWRT